MACIRADKEVSNAPPYTAANNNSIVQIYTDWANHYLEKAKFRRFIQDLQVDLQDGVLLADIIEAVACEKVRDVNRKPKSASQMMDNINACLDTLVRLGVSIDGLTARDIRDGNLKAILGVFFGLSRHKQHQKQMLQEATPPLTTTTTYNIQPLATPTTPVANHTSAISRPIANENNVGNHSKSTPAPSRQQQANHRLPTSIPTPHSNASSTNSTLRRSIPTATDSRVRGLGHANLPNGDLTNGKGASNLGTTGNGGGGSRVPSACSSRSTSPSGSISSSLIPQPTSKGQGAVGSIRIPTAAEKNKSAAGVNSLCAGGLNLKSAKTKVQGASGNSNIPAATLGSNLQGKNSMLDKFKFFNSKDKVSKVGGGGNRVVVSQRTSSSSGFSSAKSEKSDTSPGSVCSESKSVASSVSATTAATATTTRSSNELLEAKSASSRTLGSAKSLAKTDSPGNQRKVKKLGEGINAEDEMPIAAIHPDNPVRESRIANLAVANKNSCEIAACDSNRHLSGLSGGTQSVATSTTSIPKPTAAVKGTTKVLVDEHRKASQLIDGTSSGGEAAQSLKKSTRALKSVCKKTDSCSQVDINQLISESMAGGGGGSGAQPMLKSCRTASERGRHDTAVAMVSPMPCDPESSGASDSILLPLKGGSDSGGSVDSSGGGSVTRSKVETTFDPSDKVTTRETRAGRETTFSEDPEDMVVNIKPMQPISRASPYGYVNHLPVSSAHSNHASSTFSSIYNTSRAVVPSRLGVPCQYNNGGGGGGNAGGRQVYSGNGGEMERHLLDGAGYVSDSVSSPMGDSRSNSVVEELVSGYITEGGAVALSPRRPFLHTRFKETMSSVRDGKNANECNLLSQHKLSSVLLTHDFGLHDNRSINSSLSDTIAQLNHSSNQTADLNTYRLNAEAKKENSSFAQQQELVRKCVVGADKKGSPKSKRKTSSSSKSDGRNDDERRKISTPLATDSPAASRSKGQQQPLKPSVGALTVVSSSSGGRRPNSTCSASSSTKSSSKSGSSGRSKKSSLCGVEGGDMQDVGGLSTSIPRPGSAASCRSEVNTRATLERRNARYANKISSDLNSDLNCYTQGEIYNYGHGSLGRRLPTNSSLGRDLSSVISNTHPNFSSRSSTRPLHSKSVNNGGGSDIYNYGDTMPHSSSPYSWLGRSPHSLNSNGGRNGMMSIGGSLTEAESMESLVSNGSSSIHAQIQHARANSITQALHHHRNQPVPASNTIVPNSHTSSPRLTRSNSIRSTKSEKLYPSMMRRSDEIDCLSDASPSHNDGHRVACRRSGIIGNGTAYPSSLLNGCGSHSTNSSPCHVSSRSGTNYGGLLFKVSPGSKDEEDVHGSQLSLASVASSLYSSPEDKHNHEIRKLRRELAEAHDKVHTLTNQLKTNGSWSLPTAHSGNSGNSALWSQHDLTSSGPPGSQDWQAHVVAAFEQSLANMTNRLQTLTQTAEKKDSELNELRGTIESLKKQSADAGLISTNFSKSLPASPSCNGHYHTSQRYHPRASTEGSESGSEVHRSMNRQLSTDSMSSVNSVSSTCSAASHRSSDTCSSSVKKKKKIGWLRSSFSKAFSKSKRNRHGSVSDVEDSRHNMLSDSSAPNSPLLGCPPKGVASLVTSPSSLKSSHSSSMLKDLTGGDVENTQDAKNPEMVIELKKQLREKEMVLTDIRLEALSSAHQLESLKETVNRMRTEMVNLKNDNERLQRLVITKSLTSSQSSIPTTDPSVGEVSLQRNRLSSSDMSAPANLDCSAAEGTNGVNEGKRVTVSVFIGRSVNEDDSKGGSSSTAESKESSSNEVIIGVVYVSGKTRWDILDGMVRKTFKEYVLRIDPASNLGLNSESVNCYSVGEITVTKEFVKPELLPCGYLVGENTSIKLILKGTEQNSVDSLAFHTLIPKSIVHRYMSLLNEHRRIILCGPSGTGKTFLAHRLAEFLVLRSGKQLLPGSVATFQVDHRSAKELRQYLSNVAEQCEGTNASDLPSVIILDNLHHVGSLGEVFNGFLSAKYHKCPYIIGTMNQATCSTTNLQLHHNFRWVLCANHMEPVKGFLGRYLRRKLIDVEVKSNQKNSYLVEIIDWFPKVWQHLNKFLETHSSSDVTIGPRLFLSCPIDVAASQVWFTDLWNYSIVPYLLEAVREGLQLYGRRAPWEDPTEWVIESYPWPTSGPTSVDWPSLLRMRPEDVGYEGHPGPGGLVAKSLGSASSELEGDPLLNMLMRLQEAASYSSPHSNDSDSLDSHESSSVHTEDTASVSSSASGRQQMLCDALGSIMRSSST